MAGLQEYKCPCCCFYDPFGIVYLEAVTTEGTTIVFIRYEIGSTGWAIFFLEKCSVRLPFFWISRPLQNECRFCFLCIRFYTLRQVGFTSICRSGDFCCFVCIYNIFKYDRADSIIHQVRLIYILIKCIIDAGPQIIFRVSYDLLWQLRWN